MGYRSMALIDLLRTDRSEILDQEGHSPRGQAILADLDRFNRLSGLHRLHRWAIRRHYEALGRPRPFRVLDVGTGHGAMLHNLATWADEEGIEVELTGVDLHPAFVEMAQARIGDRGHVFQGDATDLDAEEDRWDLSVCALMLHHLPQPVRPGFVRELARVSRSVYLMDLRVSFYGALGAACLLPLAVGREAWLDGILSVRRSATFPEFQALIGREARGCPIRPVRLFPTAMLTLPRP